MDKIIMAAGVIAIVLVLGVGIMLSSNNTGTNPNTNTGNSNTGGSKSPSTTEDNTDDNTPDNFTLIRINQSELEDIIKPDVEGNCTLYKHVTLSGDLCKGYKCFGIAGEWRTFATNEYTRTESEECFCRPTKYGCVLYQKVEIHLT